MLFIKRIRHEITKTKLRIPLYWFRHVGLDLPLSLSATAVLGSGLRALERPDWIFWCYVASSIVALAIGVPLAATMGVGGAVGGLLLSSLTTGLLMLLFYKRSLRQCETS